MRRAVGEAKVRLHLDNAAGRFAVNQDLAQTFARDFDRATGVERAWEYLAGVQKLSERNRIVYVRMLTQFRQQVKNSRRPRYTQALAKRRDLSKNRISFAYQIRLLQKIEKLLFRGVRGKVSR